MGGNDVPRCGPAESIKIPEHDNELLTCVLVLCCHRLSHTGINITENQGSGIAEVGITGPIWHEIKTAVIRKTLNI
jgi:hypothetical protein